MLEVLMRNTDNELIQKILTSEISESFIRSSGPGGQNVNKVSSAVELRFNILSSQILPAILKSRLLKNLQSEITINGEIVIVARESRSQEENRKLARTKLLTLIKKGLFVPKVRKKSKATKSSIEKRIQKKQKRGEQKRLRSKIY